MRFVNLTIASNNKPVISNTLFLEKSNGINGLFVEPGDPSSIAAAIEQLITDENLRERLSEAAQVTSREHDIDDYVVRLSDLYSAA